MRFISSYLHISLMSGDRGDERQGREKGHQEKAVETRFTTS